MLRKMIIDRKEKRRKCFAGIILLFMVLLTAITVGMAANGAWDLDGSYSLVIKKDFQFNEDTPNEVKNAAKNQKYTFKITGTRKKSFGESGYKDIEVNTTITLPRDNIGEGEDPWTSEELKSDGPFNVTVTEITDNIEIKDDNGNYYNMSDSSSDASVTISSRKHELKLRSNSTLTIKLPPSQNNSNNEPIWFHVTSRAYDGHNSKSFVALNEFFPLMPGKEKKFEMVENIKLPAGIYTIEQIMAPDGFDAELGERIAVVAEGEEGKFYINGATGRLTLTAEGNKGDGEIHHFVISNPGNADFTERTVSMESGENYVLDGLPNGEYTIKEYSRADKANIQYSVTVPQTSIETKSGISSAISYTSERSWKSFSINADYVQLISFGPLCNGKKNTITGKMEYTDIKDKTILYKFNYGILNSSEKIVRRDLGGPYNANDTRKMSNPPKLKFISKNKALYFSATNVSSTDVNGIKVSWKEYTEKEKTTTYDKAGIESQSFEVDERGWITITAPAIPEGLSPSEANNIIYYYRIQDSKNNIIPGPTEGSGTTDRDNTTVKLKAGESITLNNLNAGSYKITETVDWDHASFTMAVDKDVLSTTQAERTLKLSMAGSRKLTIIKPGIASLPDGKVIPEDAKQQNYSFKIEGPSSFYKEVVTAAGKYITIELPEAGQYAITPLNDKPKNYQINYTDSGAIYGTAEGHDATITFKNSFKPGAYGYRYIHEYYIKEEDGSYTHEGNSYITTVRGRNEGETYIASDITPVPNFKDQQYEHFDEAYGWVTPIGQDAEQLSSMQRTATPNNATSSNSLLHSAMPRKATSSSLKQNDVFDKPINKPSAHNSYRNSNKGILTEGIGIAFVPSDNTQEQKKRELKYTPVDDKDIISVTEDAREIIILRYYRERKPKGNYNVIHVYYRRDSKGDHWEGISGVLPQDGELDIQYTADTVERKTVFKPEGAKVSYTYTFDNRPQYGVLENISDENAGNEMNGFAGGNQIYRPNNDWKFVTGTEEGKQIIILRYYRDPSQIKKSYNIVHEYYLREKNESSVSDENITTPDEKEDKTEDAPTATLYKTNDNYNDNFDSDSSFSGTFENKDDNYTYTFEGNSEIVEKEPKPEDLEKSFTEKDVERKNTYKPLGESTEIEYTSLDAGYGIKNEDGMYECINNKESVIATENGDEIIILRYFHEKKTEEEPPTVSYKYVHEYYLKHPDGTKTLEGKSLIREVSDAESDVEYKNTDVTLEPEYERKTYTYFNYGYGTVVSDKDYHEEPGKSFVYATESGEQIIILRYERETKPDEEPPKVSYKYVHEYYLKHPDGSLTLEGKSDIGVVSDAEPGVEYNDKNVTQVPRYGEKTYTYFNCGYGAMLSDKDYSELPDKTFVYATESGEQIIILRYEREIKPEEEPPKVSYRYIHEYYLKHQDGSRTLEGKSDIGVISNAESGVEYNDKNVTQMPRYGEKTYAYFNCGYGAMLSGKDYGELPDKTFVYATESGEQIIILRYEREEKPSEDPTEPSTEPPTEPPTEPSTEPPTEPSTEAPTEPSTETPTEPTTTPPQPTSPSGGGGGGRRHSDPDPIPTTTPTTAPVPVPETPAEPVFESVPETSPVPEPESDTPGLPDPNTPGSPESITIMEDGVPKTYIKVWDPEKEEFVYLEEDEVPLSGLDDPSLPKTSDNTNFFLWISLVIASLGGIIAIGYRRSRKKS